MCQRYNCSAISRVFALFARVLHWSGTHKRQCTVMMSSNIPVNSRVNFKKNIPVSGFKLKSIALAVLATLGSHAMAADEPLDGTARTNVTQSTSRVEMSHQIQDAQLLLRIQQKIDADSREIDAMALRIKEMIRDRHNTDAVNQQTSRQIEQLHSQLAELLTDRQEAEKRWSHLLAEKQNLQRQLDALRDQQGEDRANLASLAGAAKQRESTILGLGSDIDKARVQLQDKQAELAELANKLGNIQGKYDDAKDRIANLNGDLARANDKADGLLAERSRLSGEINSMQSQQGESAAALNKERDAHANALAELAAMQSNLANAQQEIESLQNARDALSKDKSMLLASASKLDSRLKYLQAELDNRVTEIQAANSGFINIEEKLDKTNAELAQAKARVSDADGHMRKLKAELAKLNTDHSLALKDNQVLQSKIATLKSDITEKKRDNTALAKSHQSELERQALVVANLQDKIDALTEKNSQAKIQQLALQGEYDSRLDEIEQLNQHIAALSGDKDSVSNSHQLLSAQYQDVNQQKNKLQSELAALQKQNSRLGSERDSLSALRNSLSSQRDDLTKERDAYLAQLNSMTNVRDELAVERDGIAVARDTMQEKLNSLRAERNSLINDVKNLKSERQAITAKSDEYSKQAKDLAAKDEEQTDIIDRLDAHIASMEAEATAAENALASLTAQSEDEAEKLRQQLAASQQQLDASNNRLRALLMENKNIENERNQLISDAEALRKSLSDELAAAELNFVTVQKAREDSSIPLRLGSADFFATGSAELTEGGRENLQKLSDIIAKFEDRRIVVAGHTDSKKIGQRLKSRYFSNWELSVARAASAVRFMQHQSNIDPVNLSASGYSEYFPVADNASPEGRQMNRRVEVILYPRQTKEKFYSELED